MPAGELAKYDPVHHLFADDTQVMLNCLPADVGRNNKNGVKYVGYQPWFSQQNSAEISLICPIHAKNATFERYI
jgi:hypothetical protein